MKQSSYPEKPGVEVCWQVSGIRNDTRAKQRPFVAERPKNDEERGTLLHPEDHGQPESRGLRWRRSPERIPRGDKEPRRAVAEPALGSTG